MKHGFVKVAAVTPKIKVADTAYNVGQISLGLKRSEERRVGKECQLTV